MVNTSNQSISKKRKIRGDLREIAVYHTFMQKKEGLELHKDRTKTIIVKYSFKTKKSPIFLQIIYLNR